jgi:hypothetical protein
MECNGSTENKGKMDLMCLSKPALHYVPYQPAPFSFFYSFSLSSIDDHTETVVMSDGMAMLPAWFFFFYLAWSSNSCPEKQAA